ncbi:hypothetical protein M885DRAFT_552156 [Pelagophyceae sp. CCMP2097]|nr:hypothetical protein M885DRAFT_552156 [Pelagophyceae sp. CCMP2097]
MSLSGALRSDPSLLPVGAMYQADLDSHRALLKSLAQQPSPQQSAQAELASGLFTTELNLRPSMPSYSAAKWLVACLLCAEGARVALARLGLGVVLGLVSRGVPGGDAAAAAAGVACAMLLRRCAKDGKAPHELLAAIVLLRTLGLGATFIPAALVASHLEVDSGRREAAAPQKAAPKPAPAPPTTPASKEPVRFVSRMTS